MARTKNTKQGKAKKVQEDQPQVEEIQKKRIRKGQVSIQEVFIVIDEVKDEVIKVNLIITYYFHQVEYYVKWKGFAESTSSWESVEKLTCKDLIAAYEDSLAKKDGKL